MTQPLLDAVRRYTEAHSDSRGVAQTPIAGMKLIRTTRTGELPYGIERSLLCLVVQGAKQVTSGARTLAFDAGDTLLVNADAPTVSRVTKASRAAPYLSFALHLDPALIAELSVEMKAAPRDGAVAPQPLPTDAEVAETAFRMVRLLDRPASVPVLQRQLVREMHHWLLTGRHGPAIRDLGVLDGHARRIAQTVEMIRSTFRSSLSIQHLASVAGMSRSTFHHHFRAVTSLSPVQFQKQLRLIEARRNMLADGACPSRAAYAVGYESVPQFTREYSRLFGLPPAREVGTTRRRMQDDAPKAQTLRDRL